MEVRRLDSAATAGADHLGEVALETLVTFAGTALQPGAVGHEYPASPGRDQAFRRQLLNHCIDRRPLDAEEPSKGFLRQLDPVAGAILRVQQPPRGTLG